MRTSKCRLRGTRLCSVDPKSLRKALRLWGPLDLKIYTGSATVGGTGKSLEIPQPTPVSKSFATLLACRYVHIVMAQCCQVIKLACGHACCHHASCYYTCPCSASMFVSHENTFCTNNLYLTSFPNQHAVSTASFPALFSRARQPTTSCSAKWTTQSSHVFRKPYQAPD